jgi:tetratricopeptide (TPR) repeat protein
MKKIIFLASICFLVLNVSAQISTPAASPNATVGQQVGLATVTINYGRPSLKGRKMLGATNVPYGKVWRTGANKVTTFELSADLTIEGKVVPKGKYALVTIPDAKEWTVILNKDAEQWGTYNYKEANDVFRFKVKAEATKTSTETLTIEFVDTKATSASVLLRWEKTQIKFKLMHDADAQIVAEIKEKTANPDKISNDTYYDAADYYFNTNRDLNLALTWAARLVEKDPQSWTYALHGKIAAKLGQCDVAIASATKGLAMAEKEQDGAEILANKKILESCGKK